MRGAAIRAGRRERGGWPRAGPEPPLREGNACPAADLLAGGVGFRGGVRRPLGGGGALWLGLGGHCSRETREGAVRKRPQSKYKVALPACGEGRKVS